MSIYEAWLSVSILPLRLFDQCTVGVNGVIVYCNHTNYILLRPREHVPPHDKFIVESE